jgi:hypothetical protein
LRAAAPAAILEDYPDVAAYLPVADRAAIATLPRLAPAK